MSTSAKEIQRRAKMPDFLAEDNNCGQTVLQLVSRGNAIIAELLRLKDYIPETYRLTTKEIVQKYGEIIMDFNYFKIEEVQNAKIENSDYLQDIDDEFRDNHIEMINRFYLTFESIHTYITDLNHFLDELEDGIYIHQSLETIFNDMEGKQLMCESLYLYGLMLLIIDMYIEGPIREKLLVSYYRYTPQRSDTQSRIDDVCKLFRDTGYNTNKKPNNYPEDYFKRISIKSQYVDMVIGHLRSDDIYSQLSLYPLPKHRSTALANQAAMLYVCLYFSTHILHNQTAIMREIVDKYFPDNWVVSLYMGLIVNLAEVWEPFRAAKLALNNTLDLSNVKHYAANYGQCVLPLLKATNLKLKDTITKEFLLKDIGNIINLLRDCNFTIRWMLLHTKLSHVNKKWGRIRELVLVESNFDEIKLFKLLLNTAQLELLTKECYRSLLVEKDQQWLSLKQETVTSLTELSQVFSGERALTRIVKNPDLERWFLEISHQVESLTEASPATARKIVQLIQALEEVQEFHQLESNMQIVQFLQETRKYLNQMICNMNIKEDILIQLQIIGDLSYAWDLIDSFTSIMQLGVKNEPTLVIKLRAIFLKLATAMEIPLMRINQARSEDLISVSQYYSGELEIYVRRVLQIIPKMMFEKMARIIQIQTSVLKELPTRLDKDKLKDYAQLNERFEFAELTHSISVFSQGMRMMKTTLVGVICLDPKQLLEDGIRKELVQYISKALHTTLIFSTKPKMEEIQQRLTSLSKIMDGYKKSFEYIQDYININALKIWQEEVTRIINYNVERECNGFLRNKVWQSVYQSRHVPIPLYASQDQISENFIGRLAREIIRLTDARQSVFIEDTSTWYDVKTHKPVFHKESVELIGSAIEISGLVGLDRLFSFMIIAKLQKIVEFLEEKNAKVNSWHNVLKNIQLDLANVESVQNPIKFYQNCVNRTTKIWTEFLDCILIIGQLQLLRNLIAFHLNKSCKFNAKNLESSLKSLNRALFIDVTSGKYYPSEEILSTLNNYYDYSGLNNPFNKIYVTSKYNENHYVTLFMFVIAHLPKIFLLKQLANINRRNSDQIDGVTFAVAVHTLIKQFHVDLSENFMKLMANYIIQLTKYGINVKNSDLPLEVVLAMNFLEIFTNYSNKTIRDYIPEEILHLQQFLMAFNG